jgi:DNA repair exonuclease SbcCD nuclease subunit
MIKIMLTGDNHFGKKYDRYPDAKGRLLQSRFDTLEGLVQQAEREECDFLAVAGDLFDSVSTVKQQDVQTVVGILAKFSGRVLVLPGNHDYYTGDEKVWRDFQKALDGKSHNVILLSEFREYTFDVGEETVAVYPACCPSKHSPENTLGWIKAADIDRAADYRIGMAHGAIHGLTPDTNGEYFLMTEAELQAIPMDVWLIGHTHIAYPALEPDKETVGHRIYNAGTHEQLDLHNNTEGNAFVITLSTEEGQKRVSAHRFVSGRVRYYDKTLKLSGEREDELVTALRELTADMDDMSVLRVNIQGAVSPAEYDQRGNIYSSCLQKLLAYEVYDSELSQRMTLEKIRDEFSEIGFAAQLLEALMDDPKEAQMAYGLLKECLE